ncbi:hypothetical protein EVAR_54850_1 [Eumeta japonica]|uniref:Uncharacterized protein n=1 Tax=Eumeta variegata TaxID=151549 RepID=A0A4C1YCQ6_EUMVA|nr:hypothetical protein EVAR_54850_1 [Eumeta japonica]
MGTPNPLVLKGAKLERQREKIVLLKYWIQSRQEQPKEPPQNFIKQNNKKPDSKTMLSRKSKKERISQPPKTEVSIKADTEEATKVCNTVDKIRKTAAGDMLTTLSRESTHKGQVLQKTIADILKQEAKVINTEPEKDLEICDLDDTTTQDDVLEALQKVAGNECGITAEIMKIGT